MGQTLRELNQRLSEFRGTVFLLATGTFGLCSLSGKEGSIVASRKDINQRILQPNTVMVLDGALDKVRVEPLQGKGHCYYIAVVGMHRKSHPHHHNVPVHLSAQLTDEMGYRVPRGDDERPDYVGCVPSTQVDHDYSMIHC